LYLHKHGALCSYMTTIRSPGPVDQ
jgi:hypothetical protein